MQILTEKFESCQKDFIFTKKIIMLLQINQVSKHYAAHTALNKVSLSVKPQSIFGLLGPNGAGKTSLIRIITQITAPDEGEVFFESEPLAPKHIAYIGYLPEERGLYKKMKVGEQLMYLARLKGMKAAEAKQKLKEWFLKFEITAWWEKSVEDLSKGMQQKIQFIATVLHEPKLIILDEPFTGFDPVNANLIKDEILDLRKKGATIIFSTHRMESVEELCDHIALIHRSQKVLDGKKTDIKNQFRSRTFLIESEKALQLPSESFKVLEHKELEASFFQKVQIIQGENADLVAAIIAQSNLISFQEHLPSMNDIFIQAVKD
jgi:ABC-2 type transport system ATP-binding protein